MLFENIINNYLQPLQFIFYLLMDIWLIKRMLRRRSIKKGARVKDDNNL